MEKVKYFEQALKNEIAIDLHYMSKNIDSDINYVPIRPSKSINFLEKFKVNLLLYNVFVFVFFVVHPFQIFFEFLSSLFLLSLSNKQFSTEKKSLVLLSTSRKMSYLVSKVGVDYEAISLNFSKSNFEVEVSKNLSSLITINDCIKALFLSIFASFYMGWKIDKKRDLLQLYVSYKWFLTYEGLSKVNRIGKFESVYISNHYDRWAVLFDYCFKNKKIIMLQHGVLPSRLILPYAMDNVDEIHVLNRSSIEIFKALFSEKNREYFLQDLQLNLSDVELESKSKTVLIIGQPHSIRKELDVIEKIKKNYFVIIKPHPSYPTHDYANIKNCLVLTDKNFFPRVDVALSYESTLGVEYEASGIKVIWMKEKSTEEIINQLIKYTEIP